MLVHRLAPKIFSPPQTVPSDTSLTLCVGVSGIPVHSLITPHIPQEDLSVPGPALKEQAYS